MGTLACSMVCSLRWPSCNSTWPHPPCSILCLKTGYMWLCESLLLYLAHLLVLVKSIRHCVLLQMLVVSDILNLKNGRWFIDFVPSLCCTVLLNLSILLYPVIRHWWSLSVKATLVGMRHTLVCFTWWQEQRWGVLVLYRVANVGGYTMYVHQIGQSWLWFNCADYFLICCHSLSESEGQWQVSNKSSLHWFCACCQPCTMLLFCLTVVIDSFDIAR